MFWRWTILFIAINVLIPKIGGPNPYSRLATLAAMSESNNFVITDLVDDYQWTNDWAINSKGEKLSNKAPGAMFLAYPFYKIIDYFQTKSSDSYLERINTREKYKHLNGHLLSLILQVLLSVCLAFLIDKSLIKKGICEASREFFLLTLYFASLSSLFMNTFFGHALAATFVLGAMYFIKLQKFMLAGLWIGLAVLSDYSAGVYLILILIAQLFLLERKKIFKFYGLIILGGFLPFVLWTYYHVEAFGGIFQLPLAHQNPDFITEHGASNGLDSIFSSLPSFKALWGLTFGMGRGLFWTTPWVLFLLVVALKAFLFEKRIHKKSVLLTLSVPVLGFFVLLIMNSAFGAWESGSSPGARYLSLTMPILSFAFVYEGLLIGKPLSVAKMLILPSMLFFAFVYATSLLLPATPLWPELWQRVFFVDKSGPLIRFTVLSFTLFLMLSFSAKKRCVD